MSEPRNVSNVALRVFIAATFSGLIFFIVWNSPISNSIKINLGERMRDSGLLLSAARHCGAQEEASIRFRVSYIEFQKSEEIIDYLAQSNPSPIIYLGKAKILHFQGKTAHAIEWLEDAKLLLQEGDYEGDFSQPSVRELDRQIDDWKARCYEPN